MENTELDTQVEEVVQPTEQEKEKETKPAKVNYKELYLREKSEKEAVMEQLNKAQAYVNNLSSDYDKLSARHAQLSLNVHVLKNTFGDITNLLNSLKNTSEVLSNLCNNVGYLLKEDNNLGGNNNAKSR
jgi:predicted nuclease with TOPRIM domain